MELYFTFAYVITIWFFNKQRDVIFAWTLVQWGWYFNKPVQSNYEMMAALQFGTKDADTYKHSHINKLSSKDMHYKENSMNCKPAKGFLDRQSTSPNYLCNPVKCLPTTTRYLQCMVAGAFCSNRKHRWSLEYWIWSQWIRRTSLSLHDTLYQWNC